MLATLQSLLVDEINRMVAEAAAEAGIDARRHRRCGGGRQSDHAAHPARHQSGAARPRALSAGAFRRRGSRGSEPRAAHRVRARRCSCCRCLPATSAATRSRRCSRAGRSSTAATTCSWTSAPTAKWCWRKDGVLTATSCATGPVYEGAHIRCGVRAAPGAIERVWVDAGGEPCAGPRFRPNRSATGVPVGLCGSGVISTVTALVGAGLVGRMAASCRRGAIRALRAAAQTARGRSAAGEGHGNPHRPRHRVHAAGRAQRTARQGGAACRHRDPVARTGSARTRPHLPRRHIRQSSRAARHRRHRPGAAGAGGAHRIHRQRGRRRRAHGAVQPARPAPGAPCSRRACAWWSSPAAPTSRTCSSPAPSCPRHRSIGWGRPEHARAATLVGAQCRAPCSAPTACSNRSWRRCGRCFARFGYARVGEAGGRDRSGTSRVCSSIAACAATACSPPTAWPVR